MNKLKLMYDVINILKEKEVINGTFQAEVKKDRIIIAGFTNEFAKNLSSDETKVKISTELDYGGKKVKHESQTEFTMLGCCSGHSHHSFMKHMHHHNHNHQNDCQNHEDIKCGGIKGKLTKLAFVRQRNMDYWYFLPQIQILFLVKSTFSRLYGTMNTLEKVVLYLFMFKRLEKRLKEIHLIRNL